MRLMLVVRINVWQISLNWKSDADLIRFKLYILDIVKIFAMDVFIRNDGLYNQYAKCSSIIQKR